MGTQTKIARAIRDGGGTRCLGMFRPGRLSREADQGGTPAEPENDDRGRRLANASATTNGGHVCAAATGLVYRLR
jgi:hypothetical protein